MEPLMNEQKVEAQYHVSWFIVAYKFLFGLTEVLFGLALAFFGKTATVWYRAYASAELSEEPHNLLIRLTQSVIPSILTHHTFLVFYLLLLGIVKIAGAIGLVYKQDWGVDLLVAVTIIMFPFQFIQLIMRPSIADFLYIFIGLFIAMYLVNFKPHEWAARMATKVKRR